MVDIPLEVKLTVHIAMVALRDNLQESVGRITTETMALEDLRGLREDLTAAASVVDGVIYMLVNQQ